MPITFWGFKSLFKAVHTLGEVQEKKQKPKSLTCSLPRGSGQEQTVKSKQKQTSKFEVMPFHTDPLGAGGGGGGQRPYSQGF